MELKIWKLTFHPIRLWTGMTRRNKKDDFNRRHRETSHVWQYRISTGDEADNAKPLCQEGTTRGENREGGASLNLRYTVKSWENFKECYMVSLFGCFFDYHAVPEVEEKIFWENGLPAKTNIFRIVLHTVDLDNEDFS